MSESSDDAMMDDTSTHIRVSLWNEVRRDGRIGVCTRVYKMASTLLFAAISLRVRNAFATHASRVRCTPATYLLHARPASNPLVNRWYDKALNGAVTSKSLVKIPQRADVPGAKRKKLKVQTKFKTMPTKAQKREVDPPAPVPLKHLRDHYANAFSEFIAFTSAILKVHQAMCEGILGMCSSESEARLTAALEDAEAVIYDNGSQIILRGKMSHVHTAFYSATSGLMVLDEEQTERTGRPKYANPPPPHMIR